jgi:hypothetical protein
MCTSDRTASLQKRCKGVLQSARGHNRGAEGLPDGWSWGRRNRAACSSRRQGQNGDSLQGRVLGMVGFITEKCVQKRLAGGLVAAATRFDSDEHGIDFGELPWLIKTHHPTAIGFVVHV